MNTVVLKDKRGRGRVEKVCYSKIPISIFLGMLSLSKVVVNGFALRRTRKSISMLTDSRALKRYSETIVNNGEGEMTDRSIFTAPFFEKPGLPLHTLLSSYPRELSTNNYNMIKLTAEEASFFCLLNEVIKSHSISTTLRVAGGWVRDKLLATPEFVCAHPSSETMNLSKHQSKGRKGVSSMTHPLDIDIALDDMLGREFADLLNQYLKDHGKDTITVGMVMKNPDKSKHLETATMKVGKFWVDFVNLRAEEYAGDSRIPELMRIGSPEEDAYRRDLTINALFYNINENRVEDLTGNGLHHLSRGIISTPLQPLTTLLDDPLRILRSVRFAARLRFTMDENLKASAQDYRVRLALAQKVSRERIGGELDLMLRSRDPVGAMRLLVNLNLVGTVFSVDHPEVFKKGLAVLSTTHDHLQELLTNTNRLPLWLENRNDDNLSENDGCRKLLWFASFLKPLWDDMNGPKNVSKRAGKRARYSIILSVMVDELKLPTRDAEAVERIIKASTDFTTILNTVGMSACTEILLNEVKVTVDKDSYSKTKRCSMSTGKGVVNINSELEKSPCWLKSMEFRLMCSNIMERAGPFWRSALLLAVSEQLTIFNGGDEFDVAIEGDEIEQSRQEIRQGIISQYDALAVSIIELGLVGIQDEKPLINGDEIKGQTILPKLPFGPVFRDVMNEQVKWMRTHPCGGRGGLIKHLRNCFPQYCDPIW